MGQQHHTRDAWEFGIKWPNQIRNRKRRKGQEAAAGD